MYLLAFWIYIFIGLNLTGCKTRGEANSSKVESSEVFTTQYSRTRFRNDEKVAVPPFVYVADGTKTINLGRVGYVETDHSYAGITRDNWDGCIRDQIRALLHFGGHSNLILDTMLDYRISFRLIIGGTIRNTTHPYMYSFRAMDPDGNSYSGWMEAHTAFYFSGSDRSLVSCSTPEWLDRYSRSLFEMKDSSGKLVLTYITAGDSW